MLKKTVTHIFHKGNLSDKENLAYYFFPMKDAQLLMCVYPQVLQTIRIHAYFTFVQLPQGRKNPGCQYPQKSKRNMYVTSAPKLREIISSSKAECVSICGGIPVIQNKNGS